MDLIDLLERSPNFNPIVEKICLIFKHAFLKLRFFNVVDSEYFTASSTDLGFYMNSDKIMRSVYRHCTIDDEDFL